jgi:hypothetical protein
MNIDNAYFLQYSMGLLYNNDTSINDYECTGYVYLTINLVRILISAGHFS